MGRKTGAGRETQEEMLEDPCMSQNSHASWSRLIGAWQSSQRRQVKSVGATEGSGTRETTESV